MSQSRNDLPQILVFFVLILALLGVLIVGGGGTPQSLAVKQATAEVTAEATSAATETVAVSTAAPTAEVTSQATAEATAASTAAPTAEATAAATEAPVAPRVYFRVPTDNAIVPPIFTVEMGADGLTVEPAGAVHPNAGHFHILIDTPFIDAGQTIPKDNTHLHFGGGQTSAQLELTPGDHVLRLQFANGEHIALDGDQYRAEIHVKVVEGAAERAVYFVSPTDGATVPTTFSIVMAATGLEVMPAGQVLPDAGHFHILIDTPFIDAGQAIPKDDTHLHFGKGQLTAELTLTPGKHVLRLQFANGDHIALDGAEYRDEITDHGAVKSGENRRGAQPCAPTV